MSTWAKPTRLVKDKGQTIQYISHGAFHREDGPACINYGDQFWYYEGELHREDGPACILHTGNKSYWIHGRLVSPKDYALWLMSKNYKIDVDKDIPEGILADMLEDYGYYDIATDLRDPKDVYWTTKHIER